MDLRSQGINVTLTKGMKLDAHLKRQNIQVGYFSKHRYIIILPSGRYTVGAFLGSGSYATIYQATHESNNTGSTMKLINMQNVSFESVMRECIVHILLEKESAKEPHGPYVPRFFEVAYDPYNNIMILRTETIQDILYDRYKAATIEENDRVIPHTIAQISHILDFFYRRLQFNHRDCKPNNILYNYDPISGRFDIKLIDFGFSCLCWNGIDIHAGDRFAQENLTCFHPSRDLTQFVYATYTDHAIHISPKLRAELQDVLTFPINGKVCRMYEKCHAYGNPMEIWGHTYRFLNNRRVINTAAEPARLRSRMMRYLGIPDVDGIVRYSIEGMPHCMPERVLNPKTRRCIRRDSPSGRRVTRLSKRYSTPSPKTLRQYRDSKRNRNRNQH